MAADSGKCVDSSPQMSLGGPIGTNGAIGRGMDREKEVRATFLLRAAADAADALITPDPDLDHERTEVAVALAAEARGELGSLKPEAEHRRHLAGLLESAIQRPPAWADQGSRPASGC